MRTNEDFIWDGPGYYIDTTGERWLVGEDPDGDLVGLNPNSPDPVVQFWDACGRVPGAKCHARELVGPHIKRQPSAEDISAARNFHHRSI